jgi:uroporphyrinogen-III decarboxylase
MTMLDDALALLSPDPAIIETGRRRQAAIWRDQEPDYLPIIVFGPGAPERERFPSFDLRECYYDREKMLLEQLWGMISLVAGRSDGVPSMRANTGTGTLATVFGCTNTVFADKMPWITSHLSREEADAFEPPDDVGSAGEMPRVLDYMAFFAEKLDGRACVYCADTQSPLDLAHLVIGDAIFTEVYDDPAFVHRLLEKCLRVSRDAHRLMKQASGEPLDAGAHSNGLWMENGGIRLCEDSTTLFRGDMVDEFAAPYADRLAADFSGAWVHFCGGGPDMFRRMLAIPHARGVNFGNPERFDPAEVLPACIEAGKFYYGRFERPDGESLREHFLRLLRALDGRRKGLILTAPQREGDPPGPEIVALWRELQDEIL